MTERGIHVEEVRVGGSSVVVMSRGGPSDHIAVVPVRGALESVFRGKAVIPLGYAA
jgi:hypothetical protein